MELKDIEKEIQKVYNELNSSYEPYIITSLYNEPDSFSNVSLKLQGTKLTFCIDKVLREIDMTDEDFKSALKRLADSLESKNLDSINTILQKGPKLTEDDIVVGIGVHIIKKLAGKALTGRRRSVLPCPCGCEQKLDASEKMYIGSTETWHGEVDLYATGKTSHVGVNIATHMDGGDEGTEEVLPCPRLGEPYSKIASQTIVSAFTQLNRPPDICPYIPSVFIDHRGFQVWMYNPNTDGLFGRQFGCYFIDNTQERLRGLKKYGGLVELWAVLNHEIFFRKEPDLKYKASSFQERAEERLEKYQKLKDFEKIVQTTSGFEIPFGHQVYKKEESEF